MKRRCSMRARHLSEKLYRSSSGLQMYPVPESTDIISTLSSVGTVNPEREFPSNRVQDIYSSKHGRFLWFAR
jgi:hypothetical protein